MLKNSNKKKFDKKRSFKRDKAENKEVKKEQPKVEAKAEVLEKAPEEDLTGKTVAELRELAKNKEIKGYSTMKKAELLDALK
mgnify:CR=1 FL=1